MRATSLIGHFKELASIQTQHLAHLGGVQRLILDRKYTYTIACPARRIHLCRASSTAHRIVMRLSHPPQQLGRGTGLHTQHSICQHSRQRCTRSPNTAARAASNSAGSASSFAHSVAADAAAAAAASSGCPFTALKSQLSATWPQQPKAEAVASVPGPAPFSLQSLGDVGTIFFDGLHVAMLNFSQKYGPVCRCALGLVCECPPGCQEVCACCLLRAAGCVEGRFSRAAVKQKNQR
jgi:hypothetical protein